MTLNSTGRSENFSCNTRAPEWFHSIKIPQSLGEDERVFTDNKSWQRLIVTVVICFDGIGHMNMTLLN